MPMPKFHEKKKAYMTARKDEVKKSPVNPGRSTPESSHDCPDRPFISFLNSDDEYVSSIAQRRASAGNAHRRASIAGDGMVDGSETGSAVGHCDRNDSGKMPPVRRGAKFHGRQHKEESNVVGVGSELLAHVRHRRTASGNGSDFSIVKRVFGIGPASPGVPASRMIYPLSPFALMWMGFTCGFLLYTAIATPAVIAFHWLDDVCAVVPTLYFDLTLDIFFLCDILMSFCGDILCFFLNVPCVRKCVRDGTLTPTDKILR